MKNLLLFAVLAVGLLASCQKEDLIEVDVIVNQGTSDAIVNGITLKPGQREVLPPEKSHVVICGTGCKVNINGGLRYESGTYGNATHSKTKK